MRQLLAAGEWAAEQVRPPGRCRSSGPSGLAGGAAPTRPFVAPQGSAGGEQSAAAAAAAAVRTLHPSLPLALSVSHCALNRSGTYAAVAGPSDEVRRNSS